MHVQELSFQEVKKITTNTQSDKRGFFRETFRQEYSPCVFVQDNHSFSKKNVIRGMHFQKSPGQVKLITVVTGRIFDVVVDIRKESPSFGKWIGIYLDAQLGEQLLVPIGFAHGFCVVSEDGAHVCYKVSAPYQADEERTFRYNDPVVGIQWPCENPVLSDRDFLAPALKDVTL